MPNVTDRYNTLIKAMKEISTLDSAASLLSWDEQTFMPKKGAELRANQASLLARLSHEKFTDRFIGEIYRALKPDGLLHFWTDVRERYDEILELIATHAPFVGPLDVAERQAEHDLDYRTHFERRMRLTDQPVYRAEFRKN